MSSTLFVLILCLTSSLPTVHSQPTTPSKPNVPPLQWINLTGLLGSLNGPPGLKGASLGYDANQRNLLVFGGESQQGFPSDQTYLLNLDSLQWSPPAAQQNLPQTPPPARSYAISGDDSAASYRNSHIVIGGKGADGKPLADVWEFDYTNHFWSEVTITAGGPSARWGAVGGIDIRTPPVPATASPNNTFYLAGGFDGTHVDPISDLWRLNISGVLSSNVATGVFGSWQQIPLPDNLNGKTGIAGTVVQASLDNQQRVVALGGCTTSQEASTSCLDGKDYILNADARSDSVPPTCTAPRLLPAVAANLNGGSSTYAQQVFMLLGTFNDSLWDDQGGLKSGEVAVLDVSTRGWARIQPAGDPGTSGGKPSFPSPRSGATALSYTQGLVGTNRGQYTDTIVFGGQDESGTYTADLWVLRAYNKASSSGQLTSGIDANGAGPTSSSNPSGSSPPPTSGTNPSSPSNPADPAAGVVRDVFDTSVVHKALAPASVAILFPAIVAYRLSSPSGSPSTSPHQRVYLFYFSIGISLAAFGIGVGGLASAFTSMTATTSSSSLAKRSSPSNTLTTNHGKAGLALFIGLVGIVPLLLIISACIRRNSYNSTINARQRANSGELAEKAELYPSRVASPPLTTEEGAPSEPRARAASWHNLNPWPNRNARRSSESGLDGATSPAPSSQPSFEVTNRPARTRQPSAHSMTAFAEPRPSLGKHMSDMSWPERRSLNNLNEYEYQMSQQRRGSVPPTPGTAALDIPSTRGLVAPPPFSPRMPAPFEAVIHFLLHAFLLGLSVVCLIALWTRAPKGAFAVFLAWVIIFYCIIFYFSSRGVPHESLLAVFITRVSTNPTLAPPTPTPSRPLSELGTDTVPFPGGPYAHQPPFRVAQEDEYPTSHQGHGSTEDDDDEDDDTRQRRIEEEMSRRDVSIVTVPRRKLFLTNPS
ncbi:hypothetical protein EIP91_001509 [Steccherinum ochraceum]|uniref:Uncharacterized protein n=1 Tax=Steccherinum ochraceum TaxID=92696 RepID=A0A4R0RXM9_9APHY|nr:hypothetical protein EIP91_001509 [Steccherinum ochraceum]